MSNINPDIKPTKKLSKFKFFTLTNFPFIDEDFDALTNYELMCKIVEYLNGVITETNNCNDNVTALYDAFMELQQSVEEQIAEGFSELNVQEEVNNKLDEMVENGELNDAILNAIMELDPTILDKTCYMNVIDFDASLVNFYGTDYNSSFYTENNKTKIINILNDMLEKDKTYYFFINPLDRNAVLYHMIYADKQEVLTDHVFAIYTKVYYPGMNLQTSESFVDHASYTVTTLNGVVLDFQFDSPAYHSLTFATKTYVDDNVLKFTSMPVASLDYLSKVVQYIGETDATYTKGHFYNCVSDGLNPATYSWEEISFGGSGGSDLPVYFLTITSFSSVMGCSQYRGFSLDTTDWNSLTTILNDAHSKGYSNILLHVIQNGVATMFDTYINDFDNNSTSVTIIFKEYIHTGNYADILMYGSNNDGKNYRQLRIVAQVQDGVITNFSYESHSLSNNSTFLPNNYFTQISGYDATKTQTLKNVTGILTWVDDI